MPNPSTPGPLWQLSAAQLVDGYRNGAFTPLEAVQACLDRAAHCQPLLNAMVWVDADGARLAAEASQRRWAQGQPLGPLDGIPITLKDNLHAAGWPTRWGSRLLDGFVASHDELPVARLRAAGAVLFGKTSLPEFAMQGYTSSAVSGITRNPWNTALTPGGSSGGAAAALAAGCGPLALATDGGGSIRRPASHGGLVGFKPSAGLVPRAGGLPDIFLDYEVVGGMGRTVRDVTNLITVLAATPLAVPLPTSLATAPRLRIMFVPQFGSHPVDEGIAAQVKKAALQLEALGHRVEEAASFELAEEVNTLWPMLSATGLAWMLEKASDWPEFGLPPGQLPRLALCGDAAHASLDAGKAAGAIGLFGLLAAVQTLKQRLAAVFAHHDLILTPATAALPWSAGQTHPATIAGQAVGPRGHAVFTAFANAAGLPAMALPSGSVQGLPTGFQLVARSGADSLLLALALQYEQAHPWASLWDTPQ
jgi:aspartyl-tRNA(Asn)/glutamyl-tRNA(Gln) amidotransferase subunit A